MKRNNFRDDIHLGRYRNDNMSVKLKNHELGWLANMGDSVHGPSQCNDQPETYQKKSNLPINLNTYNYGIAG